MREMMRSAAGLTRSIAVYYGRPLRQRRQVAFYRAELPPGALAFDVGAHVGNRARALRSAGARVVAVEPQNPFAGFLRRTLPRDIVLVEAAAGPREMEAEMSVSRMHPTVSSLKESFAATARSVEGFDHVAWDARQTVNVTTLDALIAEHGHPDFLKIDVEGYEIDVLRGLSAPVNLIAFEYLPGMDNMAREVVEHLARLGAYRFNAVSGEEACYAWDAWRDAQQVTEWLQTLPPGSRSGDLYARLEEG